MVLTWQMAETKTKNTKGDGGRWQKTIVSQPLNLLSNFKRINKNLREQAKIKRRYVPNTDYFRDDIIQKLEQKKLKMHTRNGSAETDANKLRHSQSRPLFKKLEMDYKQRVLLPELAKNKQILVQRREYMKPVRNTDLVKHEKDYLDKLEGKLKKLRNLRKKEMKRDSNTKVIKQSKLIQKIKDRDLAQSMELKQMQDDRNRVKEKMAMYSKIAMDSHRPHVSLKKKEELESIIKRLHHKPRNRQPKSQERSYM